MFVYLVLLFTLLPFVELALLLWLGDEVGWLPTLLLVIATGVIGASLARWQGVRTLFRVREEFAAGRVPADALVDGVLIFLAGVMLVTPGIITDTCGFALLVPQVRRHVKQSARRWFERRFHLDAFTVGGAPPDSSRRRSPRDRVIDVEITGTRVEDS
jgi:UPF0716 protein FxsA